LVIFIFLNRNPNKDLFSTEKFHSEWKAYRDNEHNYIYFQLNNIRNERNYFDSMYDFWLECFRIENTGHCNKIKMKNHLTSLMIFFILILILIIIYCLWKYFQNKRKRYLLSHRSPTATALLAYPTRVSA